MCNEPCRLCLSIENLIPLFTNAKQNEDYTNVLFATTGLKIEPNDGLPQKICTKCRDDVNSALLLRKRSHQSEMKLLELGYPKKIQIAVENDENTIQKDSIHTKVIENCNTSNETNEDCEVLNGLPEMEVEIECDRLEQDGGETKWLPEKPIKKLSRKEKRQQYLDMVEGKFDSKGPVKCKICKKSVSKWTCFISHVKLHLGFNFVCEFCGKSFISTTQLKRHCRSHHGMKRELPCKHCGYLALDNAQLKLHERRMHTFERPYICDTCGASYHSRKCLLQHIESHRTVASVQCDQCSSSFKSSRQLSRHRYRVHKYIQTQTTKRHTNIIDN